MSGAPLFELQNLKRVNIPQREPPKAVKCLLPIWGRKYIDQFVEFNLPTWLAQGNLPGVASLLPTELLFLTGSEDAAYLSEHPAVQHLSTICAVNIHLTARRPILIARHYPRRAGQIEYWGSVRRDYAH